MEELEAEAAHAEDARSMLLARAMGRANDHQAVLELHEQSLRSLRMEMEGKTDRSENAQTAELLRQLLRRVDDMETVVRRKVDEERVQEKVQELTRAMGKKADTGVVEERVVQVKRELHSEVHARPSRPEVVQMMSSKADVSEMDGLFERAQQNAESIRLLTESALMAETEQRKSNMSAMQKMLADNLLQVKEAVQVQVEQRLDKVKEELEDHIRSKLKVIIAQEAAEQTEALQKTQDTLKKKVLASHRAIETTVSTELQSLEDRMRSEVQSKVREMADSLRNDADLKAELQRLSDRVAEKPDGREVRKAVAEHPVVAEVQAQLQQKASLSDVRLWLDSKADRSELQAFRSEQTERSRGVVDNFEDSLAVEGEARRKALADLKKQMSGEIQAAAGEAHAAVRRCAEAEAEHQRLANEARTRLALVEEAAQQEQAKLETLQTESLQQMAELSQVAAHLRAELQSTEDKMRRELESDLKLMGLETQQGLESAQKAKFATLKTALEEELNNTRDEVEKQLNLITGQVQKRVGDELVEERKARGREIEEFNRSLAALEAVEHDTRAEFQREFQDLNEALGKTKEGGEEALAASIAEVNAKLAYCVEQLQTFVEEDVAKQQKAMKKFKESIDERLARETKLAAELFDKLHADLDQQVLKPARTAEAAVSELRAKVTAEERARVSSLKEVCREMEALAGRCKDLEASSNSGISDLTARLADELAHTRERLTNDLQTTLDTRFGAEERERRQLLIQLSAAMQTELSAALDSSEARMQDMLRERLRDETNLRVEEMSKLKREQREQLLDLMEKLSAVVQEEEEQAHLELADRRREERRRNEVLMALPANGQNLMAARSRTSPRPSPSRSAAYASGFAAGYGSTYQ